MHLQVFTWIFPLSQNCLAHKIDLIREITWERKWGGSWERFGEPSDFSVHLTLSEQEKEEKLGGSILVYAAVSSWGPQAKVGRQTRPALAFLLCSVMG